MNYKTNYIVVSCVLLLVSFLIVSCGRDESKTEETKTEISVVEGFSPTMATVEETVAETPPASFRQWKEAYDNGLVLKNQGKLVEASYYFSNALGCSPGNFQIIDAYYKTMRSLSKTENTAPDTTYDLSILQIMEGFLQSQIPLVEVVEVEKILALLRDVREKMNAAETHVVPANLEYDELIEKIVNGQYEVPKTGEELLATQDELQTLREYEARRNSENTDMLAVSKIDLLAGQVQASLEYLTLAALLDARKMLVREACKTSATIAEYRLQECEQCLREMIAVHTAQYTEELSSELKSLKDLAMEVAETKGNEIWNENKPILEKYRKERSEIKEVISGKGQYQQKLENLQQEAMHMQNVFPLLTGKSLEEAVDRRNKLNTEAIKLSNDQSKGYNDWAMTHIKECLNRAKDGVGWWANGAEGRQKIGEALIEELGPIDRRYLTSEVSRCYDEVLGKYLAPNQLNPVKNADDLTEVGTILYTLNQMQETVKKQLSEF